MYIKKHCENYQNLAESHNDQNRAKSGPKIWWWRWIKQKKLKVLTQTSLSLLNETASLDHAAAQLAKKVVNCAIFTAKRTGEAAKGTL